LANRKTHRHTASDEKSPQNQGEGERKKKIEKATKKMNILLYNTMGERKTSRKRGGKIGRPRWFQKNRKVCEFQLTKNTGKAQGIIQRPWSTRQYYGGQKELYHKDAPIALFQRRNTNPSNRH